MVKAGQVRAAGLAVMVGLAVCASPALAGTVWECAIDDQGTNRGWLPAVVVVAHDAGATDATVSDPMIQYVHNGPIMVPVKKDNDARLSLKWKLTLPSTQGREYQITYDFSIFKADGRASITGTPSGYDNTFKSQGSCRKVKS